MEPKIIVGKEVRVGTRAAFAPVLTFPLFSTSLFGWVVLAEKFHSQLQNAVLFFSQFKLQAQYLKPSLKAGPPTGLFLRLPAAYS